jgi:hypothetical protein
MKIYLPLLLRLTTSKFRCLKAFQTGVYGNLL